MADGKNKYMSKEFDDLKKEFKKLDGKLVFNCFCVSVLWYYGGRLGEAMAIFIILFGVMFIRKEQIKNSKK